MSADITADMKQAVIVAAGPRGWHDNIKSLLSRAALSLGISQRRAKAFYYGEARVIPAQEYFAVTTRVRDLERLRQENREHNAEVARLGTAVLGVADRPRRRAVQTDRADVPARSPGTSADD